MACGSRNDVIVFLELLVNENHFQIRKRKIPFVSSPFKILYNWGVQQDSDVGDNRLHVLVKVVNSVRESDTGADPMPDS
jgi:hypothetical protein